MFFIANITFAFTWYANGNLVFDINGELEYILMPEGRILNNNGTYEYEYHLKDHLGSVRVAFVPTVNGKEVVQENAYYPFGATIGDLSYAAPLNNNRYGYTGQEQLNDFDLNWYDYIARNYNPLIGRFNSIDPLAEKYYSISPYAYCANNPVKYVDPNGEDVYMYFYVAGGRDKPEDEAMFWSAALTRANDLLKSGQIKEGDAYTFRAISDLGMLGEAVENVVSEMSPDFGKTAEFGLWSHGALDGPRGSQPTSGDFALDGTHMTPEGWGNINFNWKNDGFGAKAMFFGCRTASDEGGTVIPWAQTISQNNNMKNVNVYGQTMRAWPSLYPDYGKTSSSMRNNIHGIPTYMIGSNKSKFTQLDRMMGKAYSAYPMAIYQNGIFLRNQYQSHSH